MTKHVTRAALAFCLPLPSPHRRTRPSTSFSEVVVAAKTLYVAGQQGPATSGASKGKLDGLYL